MYNEKNLFGTLESLFGEILKDFNQEDKVNVKKIPLNISQSDSSIVYHFALHNFDKKDINIEAVESFLIISAKDSDKEQDELNYVYKEFYDVNEAYRKVSVPEDFDLNKITAEFKNGVLSVRVEVKEKKQPVKVNIN